MQRGRLVLGLVAGIFVILSSAAHSLLGWPQLRIKLTESGAPSDLIVGLSVGWHFAGVAMMVFGIIVVLQFTDALRQRAVSLRPSLVIAIAYLIFGTWALTVSNLDPFFLIFLIPGTMLLIGAWGRAGPSPAADERAP